MGHGSHVLHMVFIIIFLIISCYSTLNLIAKSSFNEQGYFTIVPGYHSSNNGVSLTATHIDHNASAEAGSPELHKASALEKFRFLLGVRSFATGESRNANPAYFSPSPSPSPSPDGAPAPSPAPPHVHHHGHPPLRHPHHRPFALPHKTYKKGGGNSLSRALKALLASVGIALVLCSVGLFLGFRKFKKRKRSKRRSVVVVRAEAGSGGISKFMSSQSSVKQVRSDRGPDLFYLDSIQSALEPETYCLKPSSSSEKIYPNQCTSNCTMDEIEDSSKKECDGSGRRSSFGEITTVHEISEPFRHELDGSSSSYGERITPVEAHALGDKTVAEEADEDESFHSFCDSQSSPLRLSNASSRSLGDNSETTSNNEVKEAQCSVPPPIPQSNTILSASSSQSDPPPAAPPPPPPPPAFSSAKLKSQLPNSSTFQSLCQSSLQVSTSAPPNAPVGIPAPPCPPPLPKGQFNSLSAPPPPPSQLTQQVPLGKDGSPLPKLKPLHWDKVRAAPNRSTVWDKLRSSSFEFDEEMIESLFGYNLQNPTKTDEVKSKTPSPSKHILDPKRLQNITILSKALNVSAEQVCGALIQGNGLSLQDLEALSKMVPTKEEEAKLVKYKEDISELGSAEKLVMAMLKIPFAFPRIDAMLYRETFEDEVLHLRKSFSMLEEACKELRSSRLFLKLLEAVLKTGNRMNIGTIRGGAKAFKLDALLKLADVKGTDGKTTLLHFVVQEIIRSEGLRVSESIMGKIHQKSKSSSIQDKEENYRRMGLDLVSGLSNELCNAKKTATIDLDVLARSVANLSDGMYKVQHLVEKDMIMEERNSSFVNSMRSFLRYAETTLKELQGEENRVLSQVREITEYFHGDKSKDESSPLRIFVIVRDFLSMLEHVCKELKNSSAPCNPNPLAPFS